MTDYISREAANNALRECVRACPNSFYNGIEVARTAIHKLPAADVREVKRGKWVKNEDKAGWHCSACKEVDNYAFSWNSDTGEYEFQDNFCPNCGADMKGEADGT